MSYTGYPRALQARRRRMVEAMLLWLLGPMAAWTIIGLAIWRWL